MHSIRRLTLFIVILIGINSAKSQMVFPVPDMLQLWKLSEQQAAAQYEATGPGVILRNNKGESAILRNVWGLSTGNYLCIIITENSINRKYRLKHNSKGAEFPKYTKGNGCILEVCDNYVELTTPNKFYRFTQSIPIQGVAYTPPTTSDPYRNSSGSSSQPTYHIICQACKGTGKCGSCNGKGYFRGYDLEPIICKQCSASNGHMCAVCNGTGRW